MVWNYIDDTQEETRVKFVLFEIVLVTIPVTSLVENNLLLESKLL